MSAAQEFEFLMRLLKTVVLARGGDPSAVDGEYQWPTGAFESAPSPPAAPVAVSSRRAARFLCGAAVGVCASPRNFP
ncbi:MAG: hypothetical protein AAFX94_21390 [Myxococcota bacterium]